MGAYVLRRLLQAILIVVGAATITFVLLRLLADPTTMLAPQGATAEDIRILRQAMGLDRPVYEQFVQFLLNAARGDFGDSYWTPKPAMSLILERVSATAQLTACGLGLAVLMGVGLGIVSAIKRHSLLDNLATVLAVAGQAMPIFWLGILLILLFAVYLQVLPGSGIGTPSHLILPSITLASFQAPIIMRLTRSAMLDILSQDYIRTAHSKGLPERAVLLRHAFSNAAIPVVTVIGMQLGGLLGGAIVTETVFAWPGVASLVVQSIIVSDYPVVQAGVLLMSVAIILANLMADVVVGLLDPRIRYD
jgi:peptide/nickel transport system permease protein